MVDRRKWRGDVIRKDVLKEFTVQAIHKRHYQWLRMKGEGVGVTEL